MVKDTNQHREPSWYTPLVQIQSVCFSPQGEYGQVLLARSVLQWSAELRRGVALASRPFSYGSFP